MNTPDTRTRDLPDPESAERFLHQLAEQRPSHFKKLQKKEGLLSDVVTLAAYSPLIATTLLQNPEYLSWLDRKRADKGVRTKDELLESLARFSLTNSQLPHNVLLARFRRRELMRIFLADIRRLLTVAEITEGISNLADAILENAVRVAEQELQNRFGSPQETDEKGRTKTASFAVVSLGKLGSRELNYSSDIDLLFIYSEEGTTSAAGTREPVTNREYFGKLAEAVSRLVGAQTGEGAAYRVDLRLRPNGRVGPLAMSVRDTVRYYVDEAHAWERQVLIRSRASAGSGELFQRFFSQVESTVFSSAANVAEALAGVRASKNKIDEQNRGGRGFDVKLGRGGIREIEFIAQALQLAYGGRDRWLRAPHTLICLSRLSDRGLIGETELTQLYEAYNFLRRLEHVLQMENGLQTHAIPDDPQKRLIVARRINCPTLDEFESAINAQTENVHRVFERVFGSAADEPAVGEIRRTGRVASLDRADLS
jgi:glutamate-ammonia-ligase adenylyltransferase